MMKVENDWLNGDPIKDAWWRVLSKRQQGNYRRTESDGARHFRRKDAAITLFSFLESGVIKVTAKELLDEGKVSDTPIYLDKAFFTNVQFFDVVETGKIDFSNRCYIEIRLIFPKDWTDGESYEAGPEKNDDEMIAVATNDDEELASNPKKRGRPSKTTYIDQALADLHQEHGDVIFRELQDRIYVRVLVKLGIDPNNPKKGYGASTVKKRIDAFTKTLSI